MPQVEVDGLSVNYDVQGEGEPLLLIPYTSADHACYAFQLPSYAEHFSCIALDLPGSGESDKPGGPYSTEGYADQVAGFLAAVGVERAHVAGVSLGAAVGIHLAARHPGRVRSLSLHSGWHVSDGYLRIVLGQWRALASTLPTVADVVIQGIFPWCFTPEMYVERPEYVDTLEEFVRGRPRRQWGTQRDRRSNPDHVRSARPCLLHPFRPAAQGRHLRERAGGVRPPIARRAARGP
jgi:3-oxoadipate enol-lactonase